MGRKVELPVTGAPNARPKGVKKKGKGKGKSQPMPTIGDDGGSPMFRLFLWTAVLGSLAYAATRIEYQGRTLVEHGAELAHWDDLKARAAAWGRETFADFEQATRTTGKGDAPTRAVKEPVAQKPAVKKVVSPPATVSPPVVAKRVDAKPVEAVVGKKPAAAQPSVAQPSVAENAPHEELAAEDRIALERLMR